MWYSGCAVAVGGWQSIGKAPIFGGSVPGSPGGGLRAFIKVCGGTSPYGALRLWAVSMVSLARLLRDSTKLGGVVLCILFSFVCFLCRGWGLSTPPFVYLVYCNRDPVVRMLYIRGYIKC